VLKIRVIDSSTKANNRNDLRSNHGANAPARQVPMDTVTSAAQPFEQALCALNDVGDGGAFAVDATLADGEENLILLRRGEQVCAFLNVCPHAGRPLDYAPGQFLLSKGLLICAVHGASFDQTNGLCVGGPCKGESLRSVAVRVYAGEIFLA
jgi:nitrite reductase/ring-hydroxylating ferredoxin subunit